MKLKEVEADTHRRWRTRGKNKCPVRSPRQHTKNITFIKQGDLPCERTQHGKGRCNMFKCILPSQSIIKNPANPSCSNPQETSTSLQLISSGQELIQAINDDFPRNWSSCTKEGSIRTSCRGSASSPAVLPRQQEQNQTGGITARNRAEAHGFDTIIAD